MVGEIVATSEEVDVIVGSFTVRPKTVHWFASTQIIGHSL